MKIKLDKTLKIISVSFFLGFIYIVPISTFFTPDKAINPIENKILSQKPKFSFDRVINKKFMNDFSSYVTDQFPLRSEFIEAKNTFSYALGNREFRNIYVTKDFRLMEKFKYNKGTLTDNLSKIYNNASDIFEATNIKSTLMLVPTSSEIYKDDLYSWSINDSQEDVLNYTNILIENMNSKHGEFLEFYTPINILSAYKEYPIYFNTDHHWTQLGARIAYEDFMGNNININNLTSKDYTLVSDSFLGSYYSKAILPNIKADSIYSYKEFENHSMESDFSDKYDTLYGNKLLNGKNKYQYFLNGDPGYAVINGSGEGEILVLKDSYAHAFIPFLTQDYKKIHVIDTRYYKTDLKDYILDHPSISKVLYLYNMQTFNSEML